MRGGQLLVERIPPAVERLSILIILFDGVSLFETRGHLERFLECIRVDLFQDGLQSDETLLQNFVPVILGQVNDDRYQHWERLVFVGFQDIQEVVVLKEAHGSVSDLQVDTANALDDSLEELVDQMIDFVNFTDLEHFLEFGKEKSLLDAVSEGPVLEKTL